MTDADLWKLAVEAAKLATKLSGDAWHNRINPASAAYIAALVSGAVESLRQAADLAERRREGGA